jgi:hypothetical protein
MAVLKGTFIIHWTGMWDCRLSHYTPQATFIFTIQIVQCVHNGHHSAGSSMQWNHHRRRGKLSLGRQCWSHTNIPATLSPGAFMCNQIPLYGIRRPIHSNGAQRRDALALSSSLSSENLFYLLGRSDCDILFVNQLTEWPTNYNSGSRTRRLNTANNKARHWTRSWANSIHLPSSQPLPLRSIIHLLWQNVWSNSFFPGNARPKDFPRQSHSTGVNGHHIWYCKLLIHGRLTDVTGEVAECLIARFV